MVDLGGPQRPALGRETEEKGRGGPWRGRRGDGLGAGFLYHSQNGDMAEETARGGAVGLQGVRERKADHSHYYR